MPTPDPTVVLVGAAALHLGFQLTVTMVVYPSLAAAADWQRAHDLHTRAIAPLVVVVYGALVLSLGWAIVATWLDRWVLVAAGGALVAWTATALGAAPAHVRLARARDPAMVRRLLAADRVRTGGAVLCCTGSLAASWS